LIGGVPVNALRLGRRSVLRSGADSVTVVRPWYCLRCDSRIIEDAGRRREVRISPAATLRVGGDTVHVFRAAGAMWAAAAGRGSVTVDGIGMPHARVAASDTLQVGVPAQARLLLRAAAAEHRLDVLFTDSRTRRWTLPLVAADTLRLLVTATTGAPAPG